MAARETDVRPVTDREPGDGAGAQVEVVPESEMVVEDTIESAVRGSGPAGWWRAGLIAVVIVAALLLAMQLLSGGSSTDMVPGAPTTQPAQ
jgi:hypothetical protein